MCRDDLDFMIKYITRGVESLKKTIILILALIILLSDFGLSVSLAEDDLDKVSSISSYVSIYDINIDGSMVVEEYITYKFAKDFPGVLERPINTSDASGVDDLGIYELAVIDEEDITKSELETIHPDSYELILDEEYGMIEGIEISLDNEEKEKTLVFKYKLNDFVGLYSDVALVNWSFIEEGDNKFIDNVSIDINFPKVEDVEAIESFIQGPLYSQQTRQDNTIHFDGTTISKGRNLRILLLFPTSLIPEGRKRIDNNITGEILKEMDVYETEMDLVRKDYETRQLIMKLLVYLTLGILVLAIIYIYIKYHRDPKVEKTEAYIDRLPADYYTPAELGVFMNRGKVSKNYTIATVMDLVNRGYITMAPDEANEFSLLKNLDAKTKELKPHEEYLLVWLFDDIGQGVDRVSTGQFYSWINDVENKERYENKYETWVKLVIKQASSWKFFEDVKKAKIFGLLLGIVGVIPGVIVGLLGGRLQGALVIGLSLILLIYSQLICKRTEFGAENNAQWLAFKKNIKNASKGGLTKPNMEEWDKFVPYAISIHMVDDMIRELKEIYGDKGLDNKALFFLHKDNLEKTQLWIRSME